MNPLRILQAAVAILGAGLVAANTASAQITNLWTLEFPLGFTGTYYDNIDLTNPRMTRRDHVIDFDWGSGSPGPLINSNTFSVRWTGKIMPLYSESYTFYATTDDGIRVWINNQLVIDRWFDQAPTEYTSAPIPLTGGVEIDVRVEYYQNTGLSVAKLYWSSPTQFKSGVSYAGIHGSLNWDQQDANFGATLANLGGGRFVCAAPGAKAWYSTNGFFIFPATGFGWIFDYNAQGVGYGRTVLTNSRYNYGRAMKAFPDGRFLVSGDQADFPRVYLHDTNGALLRTWTGSTNDYIGTCFAILAQNRFAVSGANFPGAPSISIFDATVVAAPLMRMTNPTPSFAEFFGRTMEPLGGTRLLVADSFDQPSGPGGPRLGFSVQLYNHQTGARLTEIRSPNTANTNASDWFGWSILALDDRRFLASAPFAPVTYFFNGQFVTNVQAGAVYLYDDTGALLRTIVAPDLARSKFFGYSMSLLDPGRILIGSPGETVNGVQSAGRVYLMNIDGVHLGTLENPTPISSEMYGETVLGLDGRRFVISAPEHWTSHARAGGVYMYDAPLPEWEVGTEIVRPVGVDASGLFQSQGPAVSPAGATFWHVGSQKLFAVRPGGVLVSWPMLGGTTNNWVASIIWPTNVNRYQVHIAGPAPVDVSDEGVYSNAVLHASTAGADSVMVAQQRRFLATSPGNSLLMLSPGNPSTNAIRFQLVRTIDPLDPAYLHDNATATVGEPVADPAGYHDPTCGSPQVVQVNSVYAPSPVFDPVARTGTIIPVNRDNPNTPSDDLVVAFYQRGGRLVDPTTGVLVANNICWPHKPVRYRPQWPANPPKIIIASQLGTGTIDPVAHPGWDVYVQNISTQAGFNPNDEHALKRSAPGGGEGVFALRDDLGTPTTSEPYVLIRYRNPANTNEWRMKVWRVVAEESPYFFQYPAEAGRLLQAPFPLSALAPTPQTVGVSGPYLRDRKLSFWARAAGDNGGPAEIVMRYFYPMQPEFFVPGATPPALGAPVPFLDLRAGTPGTPINVRFNSVWPASTPELRIGETLVKPKSGLPQIAGQSSVDIVYDQSMALSNGPSAVLIDPTRVRSVPLVALPPGLETRASGGKLYFPALPPHLESRLRYDPSANQLELVGTFVEPPAGESYLLLNVISSRERDAVLSLSTSSNFRNAVFSLANASVIPAVPNQPFDSLALTAGTSSGPAYITLAFGNSPNLSAPAEPVSLSVIRVTCPLYVGELKVIESPNPLAEQLTLRHSGDFAGRPQDYQFEWRTLPPVDGLPSSQPPDQWLPFVPSPSTGNGAADITISGPGLYTLSDNYFVCRYRRIAGPTVCNGNWSGWTAPMLAEGWIKRVLAGINPFEQRITDYQNATVNTIVSMISQAGSRAVGDVALNLEAVDEAGLIEVYETVLRRGVSLSIEGVPAVDYAPANDALLLAAGRLADLYMLLGNEAFADAADPTIAFGTDHGVYGAQATSLHCFMNQAASLMQEELVLLRGRDNTLLPSVQTHPVYNRFIWNFTRDINGGEVAYALNYNIRNQSGDVAGTINEADARRLYPQGHGDAWGHYLMAIKNYYRLLRNPNFTWVPRIEAVIVGGVPVSVDYLDERKFAVAAAARARTGAEIVNLTFRDTYVDTPQKPWQSQPDSEPDRAWSLTDWASRAGQSAYFDWVVGNAILPDVDTNPSHVGIQKIERGNIRELSEVIEASRQIQENLDQADSGRNPLGLANNVVPFDIDPSAIAAGKTHYEQVNERATEALKNAVAVFDHANASTQLLRKQADDVAEFQQRVLDGEADFNNRLIEIFGTPYPEDIGPAGTYPSGYNGPDIYHYDYVENSEFDAAVGQQQVIQVQLQELAVNSSGVLTRTTNRVSYHVSPGGFGLSKPSNWTGQRSAPGEIQFARLAASEATRRLQRAVAEYENLINQISDSAELFRAELQLDARQIELRNYQVNEISKLDGEIRHARFMAAEWKIAAETAGALTEFSADVLPDVVGLSTDAFAGLKAFIRMVGRMGVLGLHTAAELEENEAQSLQDDKSALAALTDLKVMTAQLGFNEQQRLATLEQLVRQERAARLELTALGASLQQSVGKYHATASEGLRLLEARTRFREKTASQTQLYRYKDMAFRVFRSDALQKYRAQFDLAARYAYLAAKAYDYETCLAPNDNRGPGAAFLTSIVRARSLGLIENGRPLQGSGTGDAGLSDPLARMVSNWTLVLRGQLGFNNPQTETGRFSMRNELFRIVNGSGGSARWRETLERHVVPNLLAMPEFQRHCIPFSPTQPVEPAIVIPFTTTINFGLNFFGWPAGGGDNDYDSTKFATKIRSVGVWFANYNNLGGGMINTPRVYMIPVGVDVMRSPTQGDPYIREWRILDQALPVPFPLSSGALTDRSWIPINDTLNEDFASIRRFGRFRAYHDSGNFNPAEAVTDTRLIGRSVWNSRWLLIIPAGTLHTDRNEGIQRFINGALRLDGTRDGNGVSDIKIFFQTYAYSGN